MEQPLATEMMTPRRGSLFTGSRFGRVAAVVLTQEIDDWTEETGKTDTHWCRAARSRCNADRLYFCFVFLLFSLFACVVCSRGSYIFLSRVGRNILNFAGYEPAAFVFLCLLGESLGEEEHALNNIGDAREVLSKRGCSRSHHLYCRCLFHASLD